ncbi:unnamed protein product [Urochloa decumbens]|uniref:Late embryogenesis abundant protein LEA-2 subgroup domain-containing protein n=1 Tax=Urochloa decumbens TaxID=240449 RepID=A0ABC8Z4I5_9POAL
MLDQGGHSLLTNNLGSMSHGTSTPACKDKANPDNNLPNGQRAKSKLGRRDQAIDPKDRLGIIIFAFSITFILCFASLMVVVLSGDGCAKPNITHRPYIFTRLVGKGGLDPAASPPTSPSFQLAFDVDGVSPGYRACSGGGSSWLRVSYHGMILAWGQMPYFCIDGCRQSTNVAIFEAKAEASVLREEVRNLFLNEIHVFGRIEFDVEGEVEGLGHLRCKFFILEDKAPDVPKSLCLVQR